METRENQERKDSGRIISLQDLWQVFKECIVWMLIAGVVAAVIAAFYSQVFVGDTYSCSLVCLVGDVDMSSTEYNQLPRHVKRAQEVLKSTKVVEKVVQRAGVVNADGTYAVSAMKSAVSVTTDADTGMYTVTVTTGDPTVSFAMINAYKDLMPEIIEENGLYKATNLEYSRSIPTRPSNGRRTLKYCLVAFVAGAALVYGIFLLKKITDINIYDQEQLAAVVDLPIIATIPKYSGKQAENAGSSKENAKVKKA